MKILNRILMALIMLTILACGGESEEDKLLREAADTHMEALKVKKEMEPQLEELRQINNSIQVQGRELSVEELEFAKAVSGLERRLEYWEQNHIEVPGFEHEGHDHDHSGHDHSHDHSHQPKFHLPVSDMLIIQKEFRDSILAIKSKLGALLINAPK